MQQPTRPVCRYFGGKWKIADWIISFFPQHRCYVEPFGGAASVLMKKKPSLVEVYNDLSQEMVNLFRVLRNPGAAAELRRQLHLTPYSRAEWMDCHAFVSDPVEQARRTIVMASMSFSPGKVLRRLEGNAFRSSSSGYHRHPQDFQNLTDSLEAVTARLKEVIIECRDAASVAMKYDRPDTLHYVDPPYLHSLRADMRNRYTNELTDESHQELAAVLRRLEGYVVLSGYPSAEYKEWYAGWHSYSRKTVSGASVPGKSHRVEVVWLNPRAAAAMRQGELFR